MNVLLDAVQAALDEWDNTGAINRDNASDAELMERLRAAAAKPLDERKEQVATRNRRSQALGLACSTFGATGAESADHVIKRAETLARWVETGAMR